jgi:hypothetical protein
MCIIVSVFLACIILAGIALHEGMRWNLVQEACGLKRENHLRLLQSDVCKSGYGSSMETVCEKAQIELRSTLLACTATTFWRQGEIYAIYMKITESYILLGCLILIPILYIIHKIFDFMHKKHTDDLMDRFVQRYNPAPSHPALTSYPSYIEEPQYERRIRRRPQSQFIYEPANNNRDF